MSEMVSLKMGIKFVSSLNMGEKLPQELYIIIFMNAIIYTGHIFYIKLQYIYSKQRYIA